MSGAFPHGQNLAVRKPAHIRRPAAWRVIEMDVRGCGRQAQCGQVALPGTGVPPGVALDSRGSSAPARPSPHAAVVRSIPGRAAVERDFRRLKHQYGLTPIRVRGRERVALHADLTMLARLSVALARARAIPLAA